MAKQPKHLDALFHDTLKDIYFAEKKILGALPKMAKAAQSDALRAAFEKHEGETETQVERLEQVFEMIDAKPQGKTCDAIIGLIEEGQEIMKEYKGSPALDSGLLAGAGGRALRNFPLRHTQDLGGGTRTQRRGAIARRDPAGGKSDRRSAQRNRRIAGQPAGPARGVACRRCICARSPCGGVHLSGSTR
jgi:hypothetical protein